MANLKAHRVLITGILSPPAAALLGMWVYRTLTEASVDRDRDFLFRLSLTTLAMVAPFLVTVALAWGDRRRQALTISGKIGLAFALLSLVPAWLPISGAIGRATQARAVALRDVPAPLFDTTDVEGNSHRLADHAGKVVLLNVWATWCPPCREEMPKLDRLYHSIQRYPANFLIDRGGRFQPAPGTDEPFEKLEAAVAALLEVEPSAEP